MATDLPCIPRIKVDQLEDWTVGEHPTPDGEKHSIVTGNSNSLPNLLEGGAMSVAREHNPPPTTSMAFHEGKNHQACHHAECDKLCIYCSPRGPRRQVLLRSGCHRKETGSRPKTFHVGTDSDSDSSVRSASHISTCASLDFRNTAFSSRMSLADNGYESSASLRRICSNPETPLDCLSPASEGPVVINKECSGCTRSCTNLQVLSSLKPADALMTMSTPAESFPQALCEALTKSTSMQNGSTVSPTEDLRSSIPKEAKNVRVLRWLAGLDRGGNPPSNTHD